MSTNVSHRPSLSQRHYMLLHAYRQRGIIRGSCCFIAPLYGIMQRCCRFQNRIKLSQLLRQFWRSVPQMHDLQATSTSSKIWRPVRCIQRCPFPTIFLHLPVEDIQHNYTSCGQATGFFVWGFQVVRLVAFLQCFWVHGLEMIWKVQIADTPGGLQFSGLPGYL